MGIDILLGNKFKSEIVSIIEEYLKTRKSIAKRVKRTGTGKYMITKPGRRHLMTGKGGKKKRQICSDGFKPFI